MKAKKTLGEMEQEFLEALQVPYNCICSFNSFPSNSFGATSPCTTDCICFTRFSFVWRKIRLHALRILTATKGYSKDLIHWHVKWFSACASLSIMTKNQLCPMRNLTISRRSWRGRAAALWCLVSIFALTLHCCLRGILWLISFCGLRQWTYALAKIGSWTHIFSQKICISCCSW